MNEVVRQFVLAAILQFRAVAEDDMELGLEAWPADASYAAEWYESARDDLVAANRALDQLRYSWVDQSKVWG